MTLNIHIIHLPYLSCTALPRAMPGNLSWESVASKFTRYVLNCFIQPALFNLLSCALVLSPRRWVPFASAGIHLFGARSLILGPFWAASMCLETIFFKKKSVVTNGGIRLLFSFRTWLGACHSSWDSRFWYKPWGKTCFVPCPPGVH